jgi:flagellar hook-associated protein 2
MVNINRNSPLYKIDFSENTQKLAIDIKETAREIHNIASELTDAENGESSLDLRASSEDESVATAEFIGDSSANAEEFSLDIIKTAGHQVNTGHYLPADSRYLHPGTYSFDLSIEDVTYEFQFNVNDNDTTSDIQKKINRLINNSNVGVKSDLLTNSQGDTALEIYSTATGEHGGEPYFSISDISTSHSSGSVDLLGINHITQMPDNAVFSINGTPYESETDSFSYKNTYEIHLQQPGSTTIRLSENSQAISDSLSSLIQGYNKAIELSDAASGQNTGKSRMYYEFTRLARSYSDALSRNGFQLSDDGRISIDTDKLEQTSQSESIQDILGDLDNFKDSLQAKAESMYRNPMEYVNKKVVAYKNPKNNFPNPYSDSIYAGMIFDGVY